MDPFFHLVERKLDEAERGGAFRDLPGAGKPLALDDLDGVPAELRAGYLLLKANGFVPPELEARKEWLRLQDLLAACHDPAARADLADATRRAHLRWRLFAEQRGGSAAWIDYADAMAARVAGSADAPARAGAGPG